MSKSKLTPEQALQNQDTFATTLLVVLIDKFGTDVLTWSPETIRMEVLDEFQVTLPPVCLHKIMAAIALVTTDVFFCNLPKFIQLCNVLADDEFQPEVFDPADVFEIAWGITEALLLFPPDEEEPFCDDIRRYIGFMLHEEGIVNPPDVLQIALRDIAKPDPLINDVDDPTMYAAFYENQAAKSADITNMLSRQLSDLLAELSSLQLTTGNTKQLVESITRNGSSLLS